MTTSAAHSDQALPRKLVLVVEDELDIRSTVAQALLDEGYEVATASNVPDALARIRERRPDAILCDIMLPQSDGRQLIRACRADPATSSIPILVMSAAHEAFRDPELGSLVFVAKPFDIGMLLMLVDDAVWSSSMPVLLC
ncbi:MAG: response regulator [Chloroflexi bacterium]|nr:response regulator [Chloroflexota bacterium]